MAAKIGKIDYDDISGDGIEFIAKGPSETRSPLDDNNKKPINNDTEGEWDQPLPLPTELAPTLRFNRPSLAPLYVGSSTGNATGGNGSSTSTTILPRMAPPSPVYLLSTSTTTGSNSRSDNQPSPSTRAGGGGGGLGTSSIPLDRDSMMRQLRQYEDQADADLKANRAELREKQAMQRREGCERKLMQAEDYIGTAEGDRRLKVYEDRLTMEQEDDLSRQLRQYSKDQAKAMEREDMRRRLEEKIKREKEREEAEKKRRQQEADERRKKQLEERRRQEQERQEPEEKANREQLEKEAMEAEIARLDQLRREEEARIEAERRREEEERNRQEEEALRRKKELEAELEKWQQWEREQQMKEEEEVKARRAELAIQQGRGPKEETGGTPTATSKARRGEGGGASSEGGSGGEGLESVQAENDRLNKQTRIEQRARQIAEQQKQANNLNTTLVLGGTLGGRTLKTVASMALMKPRNSLARTTMATARGSIAAVSGLPTSASLLNGEGTTTGTTVDITEALKEELAKIATLKIEQVREEQQHYMKEKRALNIARRTWIEAFKDREGGRLPTDEEMEQDGFLVDLDAKVEKVDEIVAALQKRSMDLMKSAWPSSGEGGGDGGKQEEEDPEAAAQALALAQAQDQLREKEEGYIADARNIMESLIYRHSSSLSTSSERTAFSPSVLKTVKEVERERNKCTKAKRKLKVQIKEWADLFTTVMNRPPNLPQDKAPIASVLDTLLQIEVLSEKVEKRKEAIERPPPPAEQPPRRSSLEQVLFQSQGPSSSTTSASHVLPQFRRPIIKQDIADPSLSVNGQEGGIERGEPPPSSARSSKPTPPPPSDPPPTQRRPSLKSSSSSRRNSSTATSASSTSSRSLLLQKGSVREKRLSFSKKEGEEEEKREEGGEGAERRQSVKKQQAEALALFTAASASVEGGGQGEKGGAKKELLVAPEGGGGRERSKKDLVGQEKGGGGSMRKLSMEGGGGGGKGGSKKDLLVQGEGMLDDIEEGTSTTSGTGSNRATTGSSGKAPIHLQHDSTTTTVVKVVGRGRLGKEDEGGRRGSVKDVSIGMNGMVQVSSPSAPSAAGDEEGGTDSITVTKTSSLRRSSSKGLPGSASSKGVIGSSTAAVAEGAATTSVGGNKEGASSSGGSTSGSMNGSKEDLLAATSTSSGSKRDLLASSKNLTAQGVKATLQERRGSSRSLLRKQSSYSSTLLVIPGAEQKEKEPATTTTSTASEAAMEDRFQRILAGATSTSTSLPTSTALPLPSEGENGSSEKEKEKRRSSAAATELQPVLSATTTTTLSEGSSSSTTTSSSCRDSTKFTTTEEGSSHKEVMKEKGGEEEESFDPEIDLPGWAKCLYSDLATSAHAAAYYGCYEVLEYLSNHFDVFVWDENNRTPLFYGAVADRLACVALLICLGSDWINVGDIRGDTALHASCCNNSLNVLDFLLQSEANPNIANNEGLTPAHVARSAQALELLYHAKAELHCIDNNNHMPLFTVCLTGLADSVAFLCKYMDPAWIGFSDAKGDTALHAAALNGHADCVGIICGTAWEWSVLNAVNNKGYTPSHVARSVEALQVLYEYGADVFLTNNANRTPLFTAAAKGLTQNVEFLLSLCDAQHPDAADTPDVNGDTPLHAAACNGHESCVDLLLRHVRFPQAKNCQDLSPADLARGSGYIKVAKKIEAHVHLVGGGVKSDMMMANVLSFDVIQQVRKKYGSRWTKQTDSKGLAYYYDRATGMSQWAKPIDFDEVTPSDNRRSSIGSTTAARAIAGEEGQDGGGKRRRSSVQGGKGEGRIEQEEEEEEISISLERARLRLEEFYRKVNPRKLKDVDGLLVERANDIYTLFRELESKYGVNFVELERRRLEAHRLLTDFYQEHNPKRVGDVKRLLDERGPDYEKLFRELETKYQIQILPPNAEEGGVAAAAR